MKRRWIQLTLIMLSLFAGVVCSSSIVRAAEGPEEVKAPLLPPTSGEGSDQTYMQAIWVVIIFVIMLAVLYPTAWKNVLAGLKAREEKIRGDIANAEVARSKAETTLKELSSKLADADRTARETIAKAVTEAETAAASLRAARQAELEEMKEKALKEIESAKTAALREVYDTTATLATNVAEKILRRNLNADDQRDLVSRSLEQLNDANKN
jgi:F-type H+-transporting ATPase subunit b